MNQFIIFALLFVYAIPQAFAGSGGVEDSEESIHFGVKLGPTNVVDNPNGYGLFYNYVIVPPNTFKQNELLSKLTIAFEAEYVDLGRSRRSYYIVQVANHKASTYGVVGMASYPINQLFSVLAKAGLASATRKFQCIVTGCGVDYSITTLGWHTGIEAQYKLTPQINFSVGYDHYPNGFRMTFGSIASRF